MITFNGMLTSCAVQKSIKTGISANYATEVMKSEVGTTAPERKLYHTYEEAYDHTDYSRKNILSFSRSLFNV